MGKYSGKHGLSKRLTFSAILISATVYLIFFAPPIIFVLANAVAIGFALYEFYTMLEEKSFRLNKYLGIAIGVLCPLFIYFPGEALLCAVSILAFSFINYDKNGQNLPGIVSSALTLFGIVYVALLLSFFSKIRFMPNGSIWVAYLIAVIKIGDAGAYFIGTSFGKHKLMKNISPNKTVEGALGGIFFSVATSIFFKIFLKQHSILNLFVMGFFLSVIGQVGDLAESLIKRECGVKDSGAIPGLGGLLDVMDSILFSVPFLYYYLSL